MTENKDALELRNRLRPVAEKHAGEMLRDLIGPASDTAHRVATDHLLSFAQTVATPPAQDAMREAAVERVTYAIILGSSGERAADHAKEFQTANWEDARRSAIAVIKAMPAATTQPGPGSWVPADQFVTLRHERDGLRAALADAIEAMRAAETLYQVGIMNTPSDQLERVHTMRRAVLEKYEVPA